MKSKISLYTLILVFIIWSNFELKAQDTFSIVAVDSTTGEVGSAGASCVDLFQTSLDNDHFIGKLVPGVGAINTQAYYLPANQDSATKRMQLGDTPDEIINWLVSNDVQGRPQFRQYGIAALVNGKPITAAHTGSATDAYKGHIKGINYSIQGNILKNKGVLDSMEALFLREEGDLKCKLMAAIQGANLVGADSRCASNGSSSLFAYIKVASPFDQFGKPSFVLSLRTRQGDKIEPIDSLQILFDKVQQCGPSSINDLEKNKSLVSIHPNPSNNYLNIKVSPDLLGKKYQIISSIGSTKFEGRISSSELKLNLSNFKSGVYFLKVEGNSQVYSVILNNN